MDFQDLSVFAAVAGEASFSRAAVRLHLTQPAISKRVAALETQVGAVLFDRSSRRIRLTAAGETLLPFAQRALQDVDDGRRAIADLSMNVSGRLSIGTSHHIGLHRLPPALKRYSQAYPQVDLDLHFMDSEVACEAVAGGRLELGIVTLPVEPLPRLQQKLIWPDPLAVVVSPAHRLAQSRRITLAALASVPAVLPDASTYTHRIIQAAFAHLGLIPQVRLATNYLETLKMLVAIGLGWSVLPASMLDPTIVALKVPRLQIQRELGAVWHERRRLSRAAAALIGILDDPSLRTAWQLINPDPEAPFPPGADATAPPPGV